MQVRGLMQGARNLGGGAGSGKEKFSVFKIPNRMEGSPSPDRSPFRVNRLLRSPYLVCTALLLAGLLAALAVVDRPEKLEKKIRERMQSGQKVSWQWDVPVFSWWGLVGNAGLAAALLAAAPLAGRRLSRDYRPEWREQSARQRFSGTEKLVLGAAVAMACFTNLPRLHLSLWGDEEYLVKRMIADQVERAPDGHLEIQPTPWAATLWDMHRPTNHVGYTVIARLVHDTFFQRGTGPTDPFFSEALVRLPTLLAGLLSIGALVWAALVWGWRGGVAWVALAYAAHPWFVRFGVDARAYGFVLLLMPLLIGFLGMAVQTGRWRWWLAFGLAEFYLFWSYFGSVYALVALNAAAPLFIWMDRAKGGDRWLLLVRWIVANVLALMGVVGIMLPCVPQILAFMKQNVLAGSFDTAWFVDAACYLLVGVPWHAWEPGNPYCAFLSGENLPQVLVLAVLGLLALGAVIGYLRMAACARRWPLLVVLLGGLLTTVLQAWASGIRPYHWYLIPFLPSICLGWIAALSASRVTTSSPRRPGPVATGIALAGLAGLLLLSWQQKDHLIHHPIEACRESVALTRKVTNPRHPDYDRGVITAGFAFYTEGYDPGLVRFSKVEELRDLMARADREGVDLYVNYGFPKLCEANEPAIMAVLRDSRQFEPIATLPGQFVSATRQVVRYRRGTVTGPE